MYKSLIKIVSKFVEKLLKYRIIFRDILTFLELDYIDALPITLYSVDTGITIQSLKSIGKF